MDTFSEWWVRRVGMVLPGSKNRPSLRGKEKESVEEFIARGGHITKCPSRCKEISSLWAMPKNPLSNMGQTIYDWRV